MTKEKMNPPGLYSMPVSINHVFAVDEIDAEDDYWEIRDRTGVLICTCDTEGKADLIQALFVAVGLANVDQ